MRRFLLASGLILFLVLAGTLAALFTLRDQILLSQLHRHAASFAPLRLEAAGLHTDLFGPFSATLTDLEVGLPSGEGARLREARLASSLSAWGLWRAYLANRELPLLLTVTGATFTLPSSAPGEMEKATPAPWPEKIELPGLPPVPVHAEISLRNSELLGPMALKDLQAKLELRSTATALEASGQARLQASLPGAEALLPVVLDLKLVGTPRQLKISSLGFRAAGLEANASGELVLQPVSGVLRFETIVSDLSKLSLRAEDRVALGLSGQPEGALALSIAATASKNGALRAEGKADFSKGILPLRLPEKTLLSAAMSGAKLSGPVRITFAVPSFTVTTQWGAATPPAFHGDLALDADLTEALVFKTGLLEKPAGVPLRASLRASVGEKALSVESATLDFHSLHATASGKVSQPLDNPKDQIVAGSFRAETRSLAGFPALLPLLREKASSSVASLEEAQGSVLAEGRVRLLPEAPAKSFVQLQAFALKNVRLPLAYKNEKMVANGLLQASASGAGKYDAGALDVSAASGSADLTGLALELPGLSKKRGKKLLLTFDAKGSSTKLQIKKATLQADGLSASLAGTVSTSVKGRADLNLSGNASAELSPLREYLPPLPVKISNGSLSSSAQVTGSWLFEGGIEKSPLAVTANAKGKLGTVEMPTPTAGAESAGAQREKAPLLPSWPVAQKLRLGYRLELGSFQRGRMEARGIVAEGRLDEGKFSGTASVAKAFGGSARLTGLQGELTRPELPMRGLCSAEGMDLSKMAGFVDSSYAQLVKGSLKAEATFAVPDALSQNLLNEASARGKAEIKNGFVSTASLDTLVNAKLASLPGLGDKAKVKTGGMAADMRTNFEAAGGVAKLSDFYALTPRKDEMRMAGTMTLAFDADMKGEAHIVDAPVKGSFREANSDAEGRLVVPIHFRGNLKNPSVDIANETIELMAGKMARHEAEKLKTKAIDEGKKKLEEEAKKVGQGLLKNIFK